MSGKDNVRKKSVTSGAHVLLWSGLQQVVICSRMWFPTVPLCNTATCREVHKVPKRCPAHPARTPRVPRVARFPVTLHRSSPVVKTANSDCPVTLLQKRCSWNLLTPQNKEVIVLLRFLHSFILWRLIPPPGPLMYPPMVLDPTVGTYAIPLFSKVVGPSPHGNEFQHVTHMRGAVDHAKAPLIFSYSGSFWFMTMCCRWMLWARFPLVGHLEEVCGGRSWG